MLERRSANGRLYLAVKPLVAGRSGPAVGLTSESTPGARTVNQTRHRVDRPASFPGRGVRVLWPDEQLRLQRFAHDRKALRWKIDGHAVEVVLDPPSVEPPHPSAQFNAAANLWVTLRLAEPEPALSLAAGLDEFEPQCATEPVG